MNQGSKPTEHPPRNQPARSSLPKEERDSISASQRLIKLVRPSKKLGSSTAGQLDWHDSAVRELEWAKEDVMAALRQEAARLARDTALSVVSDSDVRTARRRLFVGHSKTTRNVIARIASIVALFYGGAVFPNIWQGGNVVLVVVSLCLAVTLLVLDEVLSNSTG